ncbi:dynein intermediate chain 2, ciliary-like [Penaeus japonicus]|uniref:dynein intermediate chain 2, ciliary-like n=1 Tax=Penaeus japonicus TaxID=27405 RepID=UPI001C716407|nr:dynein intermediate chain 2, ciliary-like [Penaeus japonicus]
MRNLRGFVGMVKKQGVREPEVVIRLTSTCAKVKDEVRYNFTSGVYEVVREQQLTLDLLTLPSRVIHKGDDLEARMLYEPLRKEQDHSTDEANRELEELYGGIVSKEELARLDSQPNPFNFSERVSQTTRLNIKNLAIQTEPPPSTAFSVNVSLGEIFDAYIKDYEKVLEKEKEREKEKEKERERERERDRERGTLKGKQSPRVAPEPLPPPPLRTHSYGDESLDLPGIKRTVMVLERMVNQNIYDDITQDFRYWEDASDEYRCMEGSLLPLWKFHHDKSRTLLVSAVCWSPVYPDLFAAAYTTGEIGGPQGEGMLCMYTLKNPSTPERVLRAPCGVTCVHFHPKHGSVVAAGWADGTVVVYDARAATPLMISSSTLSGKHLLPVSQVRWVYTEPGEDLCLYSVSLDGRVTQWHLHASDLVHTDILNFTAVDQSTKSSPTFDKVLLEGTGTCIAFRPDDDGVLLVGVDTGVVFQCSTSSTKHALIRYPAHTAAVREIAWNEHHYSVFITCSVDWTVKVWHQHHLSPLITLDLGGAVAGVTWSPYSSSVFVAITDEGRVHVYDLFLRKCKPLCVQTLVQRRRVAAACVAFNPFHPIILVGGDKGTLLSLKLSPNLRKIHKDAKGADDSKLKEIELCKMERLIATSKG